MKRASRPGGFTFVELMVASSIGTVMLAGMMSGAIALQRGYSAAHYQLACQEDQMRVMDCITRDLRRAASVTISNQNRQLSLTVPNQVDPATSTLRDAKIVNGVVTYGTTSSTISYRVSGTAFVRQEGGAQTVLSTNPMGLESFFVYQDAPETDPRSLRMTISFVPTFSRRGGVAPGAATRCSCVVRLRNKANVLVQ